MPNISSSNITVAGTYTDPMQIMPSNEAGNLISMSVTAVPETGFAGTLILQK